jgi:HD-GYP domain-containing protein (c-di-GMP phosphodiesterase class II)
MSREDAARIHLCGLVHDIGKIGVRAEVLEKQAALDEGEWEEMRRHSTIGEAILLEVPGYADMAEVVRSHHERWDGAGYPDNLRGEQIPRLARLIAVADSYNAMTSNRPYRGGMSPERAIEQLVLGKGSQYEPGPVDAFLRVLERAPGWYRRGQFAIDAAGIAAVETMQYPVSMTPRAAA